MYLGLCFVLGLQNCVPTRGATRLRRFSPRHPERRLLPRGDVASARAAAAVGSGSTPGEGTGRGWAPRWTTLEWHERRGGVDTEGCPGEQLAPRVPPVLRAAVTVVAASAVGTTRNTRCAAHPRLPPALCRGEGASGTPGGGVSRSSRGCPSSLGGVRDPHETPLGVWVPCGMTGGCPRLPWDPLGCLGGCVGPL